VTRDVLAHLDAVQVCLIAYLDLRFDYLDGGGEAPTALGSNQADTCPSRVTTHATGGGVVPSVTKD